MHPPKRVRRWDVVLVLVIGVASQIKGDEVPKPLRIERIPLIEKLSSSEMDSLRDGLKVSADPQCIEALQETIIKYLKEIRESNGIRIPRQDDGDGDDGDDGDGGGAAAGGGILGPGGGGFLGDVNLPPVVPQVIGALTEAFTGLNQVVNATSGQASLPSLLFNGFANFVGQFTGNTPAPVTPPPYYPIPPGGYPNRWPSGNAGQHSPNRPPLQPQLPIQQVQNIPLTQRPNPPPQRRYPKPKPKPERSEPPKSSLWTIYKSFGPAGTGAGSGGLTDFQLAHPEGFHNELLQSISNSLSKVRGSTTERSSPNNGIGHGVTGDVNHSADIQGETAIVSSPHQAPLDPQVSIAQGQESSSSNEASGDISAPPQKPAVSQTPSPPKLVYQPEPSQKPSFLIQQIIPAQITLPPGLLPEPTAPPPPQPAEENDIKDGNNNELTSSQTPLLNSPEPTPEEVLSSTTPAEEIGSLPPITGPVIVQSNTAASRLPPAATKATPQPTPSPPPRKMRTTTEAYYPNYPESASGEYGTDPPTTEPEYYPEAIPIVTQRYIPQRSTYPPRTLPPTRDWSKPRVRSTTPQPPPEEVPQEVSPPAGEFVTEISISIPNRLTNWITGNTQTPSSTSNGRPVIINNMYYPNIEAALAAQDKSTERPRRRRRSTTTAPPVLESDYYEDEDPARRGLIKRTSVEIF